MSLNTLHVRLEGIVVEPARTRHDREGRPFLRLSVRVAGEEPPLFIEISSWRSHALALAEQLVEGVKVYGEGRLRHQRRQAPGEEACALSVSAWLIEILNAPPPPAGKAPVPSPQATPPARSARRTVSPPEKRLTAGTGHTYECERHEQIADGRFGAGKYVCDPELPTGMLAPDVEAAALTARSEHARPAKRGTLARDGRGLRERLGEPKSGLGNSIPG